MTTTSQKIFAAVLSLGLALNGGAAAPLAEAGGLKLRTAKQMGFVQGGQGQTGQAQHTAGQIGGFAVPFHASCAPGFSKAGEQKKNTIDSQNWTDWYVCSTPVISCPKQLQSNGKYSHVEAKVVLQVIGGDPDSSTTKFRVQYSCDYSPVAQPVP